MIENFIFRIGELEIHKNSVLKDFLRVQKNLISIEFFNVRQKSLTQEYFCLLTGRSNLNVIFQNSVLLKKKSDENWNIFEINMIFDLEIYLYIDDHYQKLNFLYYHQFLRKSVPILVDNFENRYYKLDFNENLDKTDELNKYADFTANLFLRSFFLSIWCKHLVYYCVISNSISPKEFDVFDILTGLIYLQIVIFSCYLFCNILVFFFWRKKQLKRQELDDDFEPSFCNFLAESSKSPLYMSFIFLILSLISFLHELYTTVSDHQVTVFNQNEAHTAINGFYFLGNLALFIFCIRFFFKIEWNKKVKNWVLRYKMIIKMFYDTQILIVCAFYFLKDEFWNFEDQESAALFFFFFFIHILSFIIYGCGWIDSEQSILENRKLSKFTRIYSFSYHIILIVLYILANSMSNLDVIEITKMALIVKFLDKCLYGMQLIFTVLLYLFSKTTNNAFYKIYHPSYGKDFEFLYFGKEVFK